jgi:hypothetical protein
MDIVACCLQKKYIRQGVAVEIFSMAGCRKHARKHHIRELLFFRINEQLKGLAAKHYQLSPPPLFRPLYLDMSLSGSEEVLDETRRGSGVDLVSSPECSGPGFR